MLHQLFKRNKRRRDADSLNVSEDERIYAVGDIHGRIDLLGALIKRLEGDHAAFSDGRRPRLIFLGDYIDRGDHSRDVVETLSRMKAEFPHYVDCLLGNHEAALLSFLKDPLAMSSWLEWGGRQTLTSYGVAAVSRNPDHAELIDCRNALAERIADHLPFLEGLKRYIVSGQVIFAHASLNKAYILSQQPDDSLLWGRTASGEVEVLDGHRLVHGHFDGFDPITTPERICVDTGAYYSGRLSAVRLDGSEAFIHVDIMDIFQ